MRAAALAALLLAPATARAEGLFVQVGSLAADGRVMLQAACDDGRFTQLVLSDTGDQAGNLLPMLDVAEDYFGCFGVVHFGTALPAWTGPGSPYAAGMASSAYRWANISLSRAIADKLVARYGGACGVSMQCAWYLTHEANLNYLVGSNPDGVSAASIQAGLRAMIKQVALDLVARMPGEVLWSPNFWVRYDRLAASQVEPLRLAIAYVLGGTTLIGAVHVQDFVGASAVVRRPPWGGVVYDFDAASAISYQWLVRAAAPWLRSLAVNAERFTFYESPGGPWACCWPGDPTEIAARLSAYSAAGVPLGASWELRWWYRSTFLRPVVRWEQ